MTNSTQIENEIEKAGANVAPRVTAQAIDSLMDSLRFESWVIPNTTATVVAAMLPNDFQIALGTSAAVSKENFNAELGIKYARENCLSAAREKLWELEGYHLRKQLDAEKNMPYPI